MSTFRTLYRGENDFDIVGKFRWGLTMSAILVLISIGALFVRELNLGIDFEGGTAYQVPSGGASVSDTRDALRPLGYDGAKIQVLGGDTLRIQVPPEADDAKRADNEEAVREALAELTGQPAAEVSVNDVGPSWGDEITAKAQRAMVFFLILISLYLTLRFEWRMAAAALVAVVHDTIVTVGAYAVFQFEVTPATVIAFLTILGYSLYDTVVVFDKVNENVALLRTTGRGKFRDTLNLSMNEVLMRSVNTSITSVLPVASMLIVGSFLLGAATLQEFALALLIGLLAGTYSSIFTASPVLLKLKNIEEGVGSGGRSTPVSAAATASTGSDRPTSSVLSPGTIEPKPRKKRRR